MAVKITKIRPQFKKTQGTNLVGGAERPGYCNHQSDKEHPMFFLLSPILLLLQGTLQTIYQTRNKQTKQLTHPSEICVVGGNSCVVRFHILEI